MVSKHGQKIVERVHVFNKISSNTKNKKVGHFKVPYLSLCLVTFVLVLSTSLAYAQNNDLINRLNRMENELETLNRAVYKGEKPPISIYKTENNTGNNQAAAQTEIRLQQIETQMRELTGRIEEQIFTINQLKQDITALQESNLQADTHNNNSIDSNQMGGQNLPSPTSDSNSLDWKDQTSDNIDSSTMQTSTSVITTGDATALYEAAYSSLKNKDYSQSRSQFEDFLRQYPNHVLSANSKYWLGETFYVEGDYNRAAKTFAQGFQKYPDSAKSADMLLKLGLSLSNTGKKEEACIALSQLPVRFKAGPQDILDRGVDEMDALNCAL